MLTSLKNSKRAIGLGIALIAAVVLLPALAMAFSRQERPASWCKVLVA